MAGVSGDRNALWGAGRSASLIAGLLLILFGLTLMLAQFLPARIWLFAFPLLVVAVGLFFLLGMLVRGREAGILAVPGVMFVILGLLLLYQLLTDHWLSWAYAWALVAPAGAGLGLWLFGAWSDRPALRSVGLLLALLGVAVFFVLGAMIELIAALMGLVTPGRFLIPVALVAVGLGLLFGRQLARLAFAGTFARMVSYPREVKQLDSNKS